MINYALRCEKGHGFDSWFQSAAAFDSLKQAGHVTCATCGSVDVQKAVMAPRLGRKDAEAAKPALSAPAADREKSLAKLWREVEARADYVGPRFAEEARALFLAGDTERAIYGEANGAEAKSLIEDGIPVMPLPFLPNRKAN
jgi:hypothetical protein